MTSRFLDDEPFEFPAAQRPILPGGPARPPHPIPRRLAYAFVGVVLGVTSTLASTLVQSNTSYLLGPFGADPSEVAWVPTVYLMTYVTANLLMVRARQQFGLRAFAVVGLAAFCAVTAFHKAIGGIGGALVIHGLAGIATAPLLSLSTFYMMAASPPKYSLNGAVFAIGLSQVPTPLSRLFPTDTLDIGLWSRIYDIELGLGLACMALILLVRLPPSERRRVFHPLDLLTWLLFGGGMALLVAVIGLGRVEWWTDRLWLGWALAAAIPLLTAALLVEHHRATPLLDLRFLTREHLLRFAVIVILLRIALAEQSTIAFGLLGYAGLITIDLRLFSAALLGAALLGAAAAAMLFRIDNVPRLGVVAFATIAISAWLDSFSTNLTRAPELYATQMAISFATAFAVGPMLVFGIARVLKVGGGPLTTFMVLFSVTQNVGNLLGTNLLGTFQYIRTRAETQRLSERMPEYSPALQARIFVEGGGSRGLSAIARELRREANIIAYDQTFALVAILSALVVVYLVGRIVIDRATGRDVLQIPGLGGTPPK